MYFFAGKEVTVLFKEWKVDTVGGRIKVSLIFICYNILKLIAVAPLAFLTRGRGVER